MSRVSFLILLFSLLLTISRTTAGTVDTVQTYSPNMQKKIKAVVVTPGNYKKGNKSYPVVYVLHGYSDNYSTYVKLIPKLPTLADKYNVIMVFPDGNFSSWYIDSPLDPKSQYETYVSKELVQHIDKNYRTIKEKNGRAITGHSMGGHGALYVGIRNQDTFGALGSMSGGVDLTYDTNGWDIAKRIGDYSKSPEEWNSRSIVNMTDKLKDKNVPLIIDCGYGDFFYEINTKLHKKLVESKIPHDYIERPGIHNWEYWNNAIEYQLLFFNQFFKSTVSKS